MIWTIAAIYYIALLIYEVYVYFQLGGKLREVGWLDLMIFFTFPIVFPIVYIAIPIMDWWDRQVDGRPE